MLNLKSKTLNLKSDSGFTLIELMVVIAIMAILATTMSINLAGQRGPRDLRIAENQLVSNIRMAQSYTLSARTLSNGQSAQFYLLKFDLSKPGQYTIQAMYNVGSAPQLVDVQTVQFPPNIQLASVTSSAFPVVIDRSPSSDVFDAGATGQNMYMQKPGVAPSSAPGCALISFAAPFAKVVFNGQCDMVNFTTMPYAVHSSPPPPDDYQKILDFQANIPCDAARSNLVCTASTDSIMAITLTDRGNTISKTVTVNAVTGGVSFN